MKWIQAIEKQPEEGKSVPVKINGEYDLGWYSFPGKFEFNHGQKDLQFVEWLDESKNDDIYVIYTGCFHEGIYPMEFHSDKNKAIKFALMRLEEKKKEVYKIHEDKDGWAFTEDFKAYEINENILLRFVNKIYEISVWKEKLL